MDENTMSVPSKHLVTIDDPVTIIESHRVLLEWVEEVKREVFVVRSFGDSYRHDAEGTTWARGHHLPDSEVVIALRAATSLAPSAPSPAEDPRDREMELVKRMAIYGLPGGGVSSQELARLIDEAAAEGAKAAARSRSWWTTIFK